VIRSGELDGVKIGQIWRVSENSLDALLRRNGYAGDSLARPAGDGGAVMNLQRFRELRIIQAATLQRLADVTGLSQWKLSQRERGLRLHVPAGEIAVIAAAFGVCTDELITPVTAHRDQLVGSDAASP